MNARDLDRILGHVAADMGYDYGSGHRLGYGLLEEGLRNPAVGAGIDKASAPEVGMHPRISLAAVQELVLITRLHSPDLGDTGCYPGCTDRAHRAAAGEGSPAGCNYRSLAAAVDCNHRLVHRSSRGWTCFDLGSIGYLRDNC